MADFDLDNSAGGQLVTQQRRDGSMILTAALMFGFGMSPGAWRARDGDASDYLRLKMYVDMARSAEAGKLHALFLAEIITGGLDRPNGSFDPLTVLASVASATERIGLVGTSSTTYNQPYDLARRFSTLDHLTSGRAGWNAVTTIGAATAQVYGGEDVPENEERYTRADEFIEVVLKLWNSWEKDSYVGDKESGIFVRPELVHDVDHKSDFLSVHGRLPFPPSPQRHPVIFQAGASDRGRDLAAKYAEVVFTAQHTLEGAVEFRTDIRRRAEAYGRNPDDIKVLPGMMLILGSTESEAKLRKEGLDDAAGLITSLQSLAWRVGLPVDVLDLDKPLPVDLLVPDEEFKGSVGFRRSIVNLAVKDGLTLRELLKQTSGAIHQQIVGTADQVADEMEVRLDAGAADGFTLMIDMLPSGIYDAVDMLVPELQRRGLFHLEYEHTTLRDNLGLQAHTFVGAESLDS
jgi:FMN-dependent oxidoreductase (nitrilotriacetate monooxygenase family)